MKILIPYIIRHWRIILLALTLAAVSQVCMLLSPYFLGHLLVDKYAKHPGAWPEPEYFSGVLTALGLILGVTLLSRMAKAFQDYFIGTFIQKTGTEIYTDGLRHALRLPFRDFEDQRSGETLSVLEKVKSDCERFISSSINILFVSIVGIGFLTLYSFTLHPLLPVIFIGGGLVVLLLTQTLGRKLKLVQRQIVKESNRLAGATTESLRNIELVKSMGLTDQEIGRINTATLRILGLEVEKIRRLRSISFLQSLFLNLLQQGIMFALMYFIFYKTLTLGEMMTMQASSFIIFGPLMSIGSVLLSYREAEASLNNLQTLYARPVESVPEVTRHISDIEKLRFEDVSFRHPAAAKPAVSHVSFEVRKGETIAFVGPSGSGKTTLIKIMVGLYQPQPGAVYYNDIPGGQLDFDRIRPQIGFVAQETQLFSGTIRENLMYVNSAATEEDMIRALHQAACQPLLARAGEGIDTVIGEGGMKLSGGEKQRLSIARALLRNPTLLLFDEATSALDSLTEYEISRTIRNITARREHITVMVAHRLSTIMHADRIYVMENGRITETGTHPELIRSNGLYQAMWRMQTGERVHNEYSS